MLPRAPARNSAAADRAAITAFRDIKPSQAARLLSFGVRAITMDLLIQQLKRRTADPLRASDNAVYGPPDFRVRPPASSGQVRSAEQLLGFDFPPLLKVLYTEVGNGGYGPGYGVFKLPTAEPEIGDLVEQYWYMSGKDNPATDWRWPAKLLPLFSHGCGIYECLDCAQETGRMILYDPDYYTEGAPIEESLAQLAPSLEARLNAWLAGEDLIKAAKQMLAKRQRAEPTAAPDQGRLPVPPRRDGQTGSPGG